MRAHRHARRRTRAPISSQHAVRPAATRAPGHRAACLARFAHPSAASSAMPSSVTAPNRAGTRRPRYGGSEAPQQRIDHAVEPGRGVDGDDGGRGQRQRPRRGGRRQPPTRPAPCPRAPGNSRCSLPSGAGRPAPEPVRRRRHGVADERRAVGSTSSSDRSPTTGPRALIRQRVGAGHRRRERQRRAARQPRAAAQRRPRRAATPRAASSGQTVNRNTP